MRANGCHPCLTFRHTVSGEPGSVCIKPASCHSILTSTIGKKKNNTLSWINRENYHCTRDTNDIHTQSPGLGHKVAHTPFSLWAGHLWGNHLFTNSFLPTKLFSLPKTQGKGQLQQNANAHDKFIATLHGLCEGYGAPIVRFSARYGAINKSDLRGRTLVQKPVLHLWTNTSSLFASVTHLCFWVSANDNLAAEITMGTDGGSRWWSLKKKIFTCCTYSSWGRENRLSLPGYLGCFQVSLILWEHLRSQDSHYSERWRPLGHSK